MARLVAALLILQPVFAEHHDIDFLVEEWVVDFMRPTASGVKKAAHRVTPFHIPDDNRKVIVFLIHLCKMLCIDSEPFSRRARS